MNIRTYEFDWSSRTRSTRSRPSRSPCSALAQRSAKHATRRRILLQSVVLPLPFVTDYVAPRQADAASLESVYESIYEALPSLYSSPSPVLVPRRTLGDKAFAVALLRSGYECVDDLDCFPMDVWQRNFWLKRRAEYESYVIQNEPLRIEQGDLTSPLYFDFIAAMQFWTVDKALREPKQRFKEFCGEECDDEYRIVTRDGSYMNDALLPRYFADKLGEKIYDKLRQLADPIPISTNKGSDELSDPAEIAAAVARYFVSQGFALKSEVTATRDDPKTLVLKTYGAATLWALQYLTSRRTRALPLYDVAVIQYLLKKKLGLESTVKIVDLSEASLAVHIEILN